MKEGVDFFSRDTGLQVCVIDSSSQGISKKLAQHLHGFLPGGFPFDFGLESGEMQRSRTPGRIDQKPDRSCKLVTVAELTNHLFRKQLDTVSRRIEQLRAEVSQSVLD